MEQNIIEFYREKCVESLQTTQFRNVWTIWKQKIDELCPNKTDPIQILNLGDHLRSIFQTTNQSSGNRSQSDVSGGGSVWESLVCWYLNLCLIGRNTIVIKHKKELIPKSVSDSITVTYHNSISNTESDLIGITFPEIDITDYDSKTFIKRIDEYCKRHMRDIEIHIIQCKTNWNDNSQIPMLWDMVYTSRELSYGVYVGTNGFSIKDIKRFSYSFVTVPTNKLDIYKTTSTCVKRVYNLSGGNYWGLESKSGVSSSIKEMLERNLKNGHNHSILETLGLELKKLDTDYCYFNL